MVLLQAAMGYGMLLLLIFGALIFIGIPLLTGIFLTILSKQIAKKDVVDTRRKTKIILILKSLLLSIIIVAVILFLIWEFLLNRIDLTYS